MEVQAVLPALPQEPPGNLRGHGAGVRGADQHRQRRCPCQATGEALAPVTAALVATLPTAPLLHADVTRWPHDGRIWWLWMVRGPQATVFFPSPSLGGQVVRELTTAFSRSVDTSDRDADSNWLHPA